MPKRTDIKSILIIGAGPIVIGQACEFDYSGTQACQALKEEGYRIILVNSNPATIMTDPDYADVTYIEPINHEVLARIIAVERPDAILPTMGGQTALNTALDLAKHGILEKYQVELIGAKREAIDKAEDRDKFRLAMHKIGLQTPESAIAHSLEEALQVQVRLGYPTIIRPSFTLGGTGGTSRRRCGSRPRSGRPPTLRSRPPPPPRPCRRTRGRSHAVGAPATAPRGPTDRCAGLSRRCRRPGRAQAGPTGPAQAPAPRRARIRGRARSSSAPASAAQAGSRRKPPGGWSSRRRRSHINFRRDRAVPCGGRGVEVTPRNGRIICGDAQKQFRDPSRGPVLLRIG